MSADGFVTKDSGERTTFATGMQRDSGQKDLRPDLVYGPMLLRWRQALGALQLSAASCDFEELREDAYALFLAWFYDTGAGIGSGAEALAYIDQAEASFARAPMFVRWAELMGRGAEKYGERNWEKAETAEELERFKASAFRHFVQWFYGMNPEEDHAAAVFFNISGAEYVKERMAVAATKAQAAELKRFATTPAAPAKPARWADWPSDHVGPV